MAPICQKITTVWVLLMCLLARYANASTGPISSTLPMSIFSRDDLRTLKLVEPTPIVLTYYKGPLLTKSIPVYVLWYGTFSDGQKAIVKDFFASFQSKSATPSVESWWKVTEGYVDSAGAPVARELHFAAEVSDSAYSKGKSLLESDLESLLLGSLTTFPVDSNAIYFVMTASDVKVEDFCMNSCSSHYSTDTKDGKKIAYVWVGNAATQCPGMCAWPFAKAEYGPPAAPLVAPNGDVGIDGMIINIATMVAGTATNPFGNGYYEGDSTAPLESATACQAIYGANAYPGYPGDLLVDTTTKASYNVNGAKQRKFLVPALWKPATLKCTTPAS